MSRVESSENPDFAALIHRIRGGDQNCFEVIVRRLERPLRAWLATHASPAIDADEVAQRTFVIAFNKLDTFEPGTDFAAWLFTIARYQLMAELKRLRRVADYHARFAPDLLERELERRVQEPVERGEARLDHLRKCLASMGDHLRKYVIWRYDEEIPLGEMAKRTGRSVGAIKKQLWQIRRKLLQCVKARMKTESVTL